MKLPALGSNVNPANPRRGVRVGNVDILAQAVNPAGQRRGRLGRAARAVIEILAALGGKREFGREAIECGGERIELGCKSVALRCDALRELARHVTEDEAQLADGRSYVRGSVGKAGDFSRPGAGGDLGV